MGPMVLEVCLMRRKSGLETTPSDSMPSPILDSAMVFGIYQGIDLYKIKI